MRYLNATTVAAARRRLPRGGAGKLEAARRFPGSLRSWLLLLAIGATVALPAAAQWKWRDKAGQVQYSDLPPPAGTPDASILQRPSPVAARPAPAASAAASAPPLVPKIGDPELEAARKKAEQQEAAKRKAEEDRIAVAKLDNCARARAQLKAVDEGQRIARLNAKGEREPLDDKGRAEESQRLRAVIASDCR